MTVSATACRSRLTRIRSDCRRWRRIDARECPKSWGWRGGDEGPLNGRLINTGRGVRLNVCDQDLRQRPNRNQPRNRQLCTFNSSVGFFFANRRLHINDLLARRRLSQDLLNFQISRFAQNIFFGENGRTQCVAFSPSIVPHDFEGSDYGVCIGSSKWLWPTVVSCCNHTALVFPWPVRMCMARDHPEPNRQNTRNKSAHCKSLYFYCWPCGFAFHAIFHLSCILKGWYRTLKGFLMEVESRMPKTGKIGKLDATLLHPG